MARMKAEMRTFCRIWGCRCWAILPRHTVVLVLMPPCNQSTQWHWCSNYLSHHLQHAPHLVILGLQPGKVAQNLHIQVVVVELGGKMDHGLQHIYALVLVSCSSVNHPSILANLLTFTVCSRMVGFVSMKPCATWGKIWSFTVAACRCPATERLWWMQQVHTKYSETHI